MYFFCFCVIIVICYAKEFVSVSEDYDVPSSASIVDTYRQAYELRFLLNGDFGGMQRVGQNPVHPYSTVTQIQVARAMGKIAKWRQAQFVVSLGDNFYQSGVTSVRDERFQHTFERMYIHPSLIDLPWYIIAGNHDHEGNVTAQVQYSLQSKRWIFPSEWYTRRFVFRNRQPSSREACRTMRNNNNNNADQTNSSLVSVQMIFLDGSLFHAQYLNLPFLLVAKEYETVLKLKVQLKWLQETLEKSRDADWLIVICHFPILSVGEYAGYPSLIREVQPLLERYNASLYVNGHSHTLQHLQHNKVDYFVVGCGAVTNVNRRNWFNVPLGSLRYCHPDARLYDQKRNGKFTQMRSNGGFASVRIQDRKTLTIDFIDQEARPLYSHTIQNRRVVARHENEDAECKR